MLATGGGAVLATANRQRLRDAGHVIYLRSTPEEVFRRLRHDGKRPLLQVADPLGRLRELLRERDPLYRETAHFVIETGRPSVPTLVNMILMQLELAGVISSAPLNSGPGMPPKLGAFRDCTSVSRSSSADRSYPIQHRRRLAGRPRELRGRCRPRASALIVTNTTVAPLYAATAAQGARRGASSDRPCASRCPMAKRTRPGRRST